MNLMLETVAEAGFAKLTSDRKKNEVSGGNAPNLWMLPIAI